MQAAPPQRFAITLYDNVPSDPRELPFRADQVVEILSEGPPGWCKAKLGTRTGTQPAAPASPSAAKDLLNISRARSSSISLSLPPSLPVASGLVPKNYIKEQTGSYRNLVSNVAADAVAASATNAYVNLTPGAGGGVTLTPGAAAAAGAAPAAKRSATASKTGTGTPGGFHYVNIDVVHATAQAAIGAYGGWGIPSSTSISHPLLCTLPLLQ